MTSIEHTEKKSGTLFTLLVFVAIALTMLLNVLSANIRLADIGIGCDHWPDCFGKIGASSEVRVAKSLAQGGPLLPSSLARTFHRLAASSLGFLVFAIAYFAVFRRARVRSGPVLPLFVLGITIFLSILGYTTPSLLVPAVTLGNIVGGMTMLALLWWIGQRSVVDELVVTTEVASLKPWARVGLIIIGIQIALGAWTSGSFAGPGCDSLFSCGADAWSLAGLVEGFNPLRELAVDGDGKIISIASMKTVHMVHRLGAVLTFLFIGGLGIATIRKGGQLRSTGIAICIFLMLQLSLGLLGIVLNLPLAVITAHNVIAAVLLLSIVNLNHLLTLKSAS